MSENIAKTFPYKIMKLHPEINKDVLKLFTGENIGYVQVGPKKYILPSAYENEAQNYYNFEVRPDDIWIVTHPRAGTTLTQEIVWLLENNYDYNTASNVPLTERFPFFEFNSILGPASKARFLKEQSLSVQAREKIKAMGQNLTILQKQTEKRFIKTHLPFSLLPPNLLASGCKVIYVARNPKDVVVSYYHLCKLLKTKGYIGDFTTFVDYFLRNLVISSPFWNHLQEGWDQRHSKNVLFLFYEDIVKDLRNGIQTVATFLEKDVDEEQLARLTNHLNIKNFRKNKSVNCDSIKDLGILNSNAEGFIRKGKVGSWTEVCTENLNRKMNKWMQDNLENMANTNVTDFAVWGQ